MNSELLKQLRDKYPDATDYDINKAVMADDMASFAMVCFAETLYSAIPDFHYEIYETLIKSRNEARKGTNRLKRIAIAAPRGSAKSSLFSLIQPLHVILTKNPEETELILLISESGEQSRRFLSRVKDELNENEKLRYYYGDWGETTAKKWTEAAITLRDGSQIIAIGTRQRIRGAIQRNTRVTLAIFDDMESELNTLTTEERNRNSNWITNAVLPTLDHRRGRACMIGTIVHSDCFLMSIKDKTSWHVMWYIASWQEGEEEVYLWPDKLSKAFLEDQYQVFEDAGNVGGFYQEYYNQPMAPDEAPFKPHYFIKKDFKYVRENDTNYLEIEGTEDGEKKRKLIPVLIYGGVDLASSLSARADYTVIMSIAIDADDNHYMLPYVRVKADPALHARMIIDEFKKYHHTRIQIESVAYQEACRATVRKLMTEEGLYIPGLENKVTHKLDKSRNLSLVPIFARQKFFFLPSQNEAISEVMAFPKSRHDDILDSIYIALLNSRKPKKGKEIDVNKKPATKKTFDWMTL